MGTYITDLMLNSLNQIFLIKQRSKENLPCFQLTGPKQHEIERATVGQSVNERWAREGKNRLTAYMFGKVCKRLPTTLCGKLVHRFLYASPVLTTDMKTVQ